jgi:large subunit ribosomal protein L20
MSRTKTGFTRSRRHKKILKLAKGFRGANRRLYKRAKEAVLHAGQYAFVGRKNRKRDFRRLWIVRISAALKQVDQNLNYSRFIKTLKEKNVSLDRKMMSEIAIRDFSTFSQIVKTVHG